jgi:hypothetical protein
MLRPPERGSTLSFRLGTACVPGRGLGWDQHRVHCSCRGTVPAFLTDRAPQFAAPSQQCFEGYFCQLACLASKLCGIGAECKFFVLALGRRTARARFSSPHKRPNQLGSATVLRRVPAISEERSRLLARLNPGGRLGQPATGGDFRYLKGTVWPVRAGPLFPGKGCLQPGGGERRCRFAKALCSQRAFERRVRKRRPRQSQWEFGQGNQGEP